MKENKRYNRVESKFNHYYSNIYGNKGFGKKTISGYIKCKLVHAKNFSVIIPDQIYIEWGDEYRWLKPYTFMPCKLIKDESDIVCQLDIDISSGYTVKTTFKHSGYIKNYSDGSQLFNCELVVPDNIEDYCIGKATISNNFDFNVELFHHTTANIKEKILQSNILLGSKWNIQGNKELRHSEHIYFTPLNEIIMDDDLEQIAMSKSSEIKLIRDNFNLPKLLLPEWEDTYKNDILFMTVYREEVDNRNATLDYMVPSEYISPHHIIKHCPLDYPVYYEISAPLINRIQIPLGGNISFIDNIISRKQEVIYYKDIIIGDGTTLDGLNAPFDEENTKHIFKIEFMEKNKNMLEFWFEKQNSDLFTCK